MNGIEQRLADALTARADAVDTTSIRPLPGVEPARETRLGSGRKWLAPAAAAASIVVVAAAVALASGLAPGAGSGQDQPAAQSATFRGALMDVHALSAMNAWAVGLVHVSPTNANKLGREPVIMHWNGTNWRRTVSPAFGHGGVLESVSGRSPDDIWAVGFTDTKTKNFVLPLIEHWNGKRWRRVLLGAGRFGALNGIAVRSADDAWAVGVGGKDWEPLILHWNGRTWRDQPLPSSLSRGTLTSVTAISAKDAWAIGSADLNLFLHWNGSVWKLVRGPNPHNRGLNMVSVASDPAGHAWMAGTGLGAENGVWVLRWDGSAWRKMRGLHLSQDEGFSAIADNSARDIWIGGTAYDSQGDTSVLIRHWDGAGWSQASGLETEIPGSIRGLSTDSASDAWAVGNVPGLGGGAPLILHWNGHDWKKVLS